MHAVNKKKSKTRGKILEKTLQIFGKSVLGPFEDGSDEPSASANKSLRNL